MDYIVRRQLESGVDVGNDSETPRSTFFGYITERMSGFGGRSQRPPILDMQRFPKWWEGYQARGVRRLNVYGLPAAVGPVRHASLAGSQAEPHPFARPPGPTTHTSDDPLAPPHPPAPPRPP